ncbi:MAG: shikimate dehydrogenase [Planctomycetota bacterium]|jgi:3-dehydroquinate dehydratase/shikimate dehydrogenase
MICIPITATSMEAALDQIARACQEPADLLELRLDYIERDLDVTTLLRSSSLPCIVTVRPVRDGGNFSGSEEDRFALLREADRAGAAYLDVEYDVLDAFGLADTATLIASYHNFEETPVDLPAIIKGIEALPCDIVKFATMGTRLTDNLAVWKAMAACRKPVIGLCMGELGEVSRVLAHRQGGLLTFGSLEAGRESAPGQQTARDLAELYRVKGITEATALYAVVGNPIGHSVSPEIHNSAFRAQHRDAAYLRFRVEDLAKFLQDFECLGLRGLSVTIPHKDAALKAATRVEPVAAKIQTVNTLTRIEGGWEGDNTDWKGSIDAIRNAAARAGLNLNGARALLLGAGGAAKGIAYGLQEAGCTLVIANRTRSKAEALAEELGAEVVDLANAHRQAFDVVANSTSMGMHPHEDASAIDAQVFHPGMVAFDAVYNPRETKMLREAKAAGAEVADGVEMFVGQAIRQYERWTGDTAPREIMEAIVVKRLSK